MAKTATKQSRNTKSKDKKPKERRLPVKRLPMEWRVGDEIVVGTTKDGYVAKTIKITRLETGYGCKNLHVNDTACYDRSIPWGIAVPESEAIMLAMGISREAINEMKKGAEQ